MERIYMFQVGQGDHYAIEFEDGSWAIVDVFVNAYLGQKYPAVIDLFNHLGIENIRIRYLIITHYDTDHFNGVTLLLDWLEKRGATIEDFILPKIPNDTHFDVAHDQAVEAIKAEMRSKFEKGKTELFENQDEFEAALSAEPYVMDKLDALTDEAHLFEQRLARTDKKRPMGVMSFSKKTDNVAAVCLLPNDQLIEKYIRLLPKRIVRRTLKSLDLADGRTSLPKNDLSLCFALMCKEKSTCSKEDKKRSALFTGDCGAKDIKGAIASYGESDLSDLFGEFLFDFYKFPHHGAKYEENEEFYRTTNSISSSAIMFASSGSEKNYNHPDKSTIQYASKNFGDAAIVLSRDDFEGTICDRIETVTCLREELNNLYFEQMRGTVIEDEDFDIHGKYLIMCARMSFTESCEHEVVYYTYN